MIVIHSNAVPYNSNEQYERLTFVAKLTVNVKHNTAQHTDVSDISKHERINGKMERNQQKKTLNKYGISFIQRVKRYVST